MRELVYDVPENEDGRTALDFLKSRGFSRRLLIKLKWSGAITRGGSILRTIDRVSTGDRVRVVLPDEGTLLPNPSLKAAIAYEDDDVVVFDKPPFMATHPSIKHSDDTLGNLFTALYPDNPFRAINRLDRNTSGLCVCAKNALAASSLSGGVDKIYSAAVDGILTDCEIDLPIGRLSDSIIKRGVLPDGKPARTLCRAVLHRNNRTLLEITLLTGRTHQIRVHLSHIGFPLCGDSLYGGDCSAIDRHALHCSRVSFISPITGMPVNIVSEIPEDIKKLFV